MLSVCQELPYKNLLTLKVQNPFIFLKPLIQICESVCLLKSCIMISLCKYTQPLMTKSEMEENFFSLHKIIGRII